MSINRTLIQRAFPNDPRLAQEFLDLADYLDTAKTQIDSLLASATDASTRLSAIENGGYQAHSALLDGISSVPDDELGVFERADLDTVILREIDSDDDACLVPRSKLVSYVGKGSTASRPTLSAQRRALYFDTTLAAAGKPVFWTGSQWVDSSGSVV